MTTEEDPRVPSLSLGEQAYRDAVRELACHVDLWEDILRTHTRTASGHCGARVCREGGTGRPCLAHPCPTRIAALYARAMSREAT